MRKIEKFDLQLFAMKNLDLLQQKKAEVVNKINQALKDANEEAFQQAFTEYTDILQEAVMAEAKGLVQAADNQILAGRGARALTSQETKYYESLIEAWKSKDPKQALTLIDEALPKTVVDAIFEDIVESHPLLNAINFQDTGILVEILVSTQDGRHMATWGKLCDDIVKELTAGLDVIKLDQKKLSAFIPICKAMLEIGPVWIDRYVRTILSESIANGLEEGIIDGNGLDEPTGMRRNPAGALDPVTGYPELVAVPLVEITPETYGSLIAALATGPNGLARTVTEVLFIINPVDYFTKLMPATTFMVNGTWINNVFPFPTRVAQSVHCPQNEAIIGLGKRYFFGLGTGKEGKIEYSDHYKFLEDDRYYLTKLYGNGKPLDAVSFKRLDITNLKKHIPEVNVTNNPLNVAGAVGITNEPLNVLGVFDARLASLKIGALALSPAFNKSVMVYTAATTDATNTITAVAKDGEATMAIKVNGVAHTNGTAATWDAGENTVEVTVTAGTETEIYTVTVTKS